MGLLIRHAVEVILCAGSDVGRDMEKGGIWVHDGRVSQGRECISCEIALTGIY